MSDPIDPQSVFDAYYYQHGCGAPYIRNETWLAFFQAIADRIIADIQPKSVLDAGCALGFLVEGFRNRGVEAWGVDISEYAIASVHESIRRFCRVGSVIEPFERKYDLIVTIEVAEHMQPLLSKQMIANLCAHTDDIIFTSTPFDYKETTHFNVQSWFLPGCGL
jgi:2-polyprenyl-3-methyl-5-hydroxy-6-metoxy-1,4-benzoquinol methylase